MIRVSIGPVKGLEPAFLEERDQAISRVRANEKVDVVRGARIAVGMEGQSTDDRERNSFVIEIPAELSDDRNDVHELLRERTMLLRGVHRRTTASNRIVVESLHCPPMATLLLFIDGIGIGRDDPH